MRFFTNFCQNLTPKIFLNVTFSLVATRRNKRIKTDAFVHHCRVFTLVKLAFGTSQSVTVTYFARHVCIQYVSQILQNVFRTRPKLNNIPLLLSLQSPLVTTYEMLITLICKTLLSECFMCWKTASSHHSRLWLYITVMKFTWFYYRNDWLRTLKGSYKPILLFPCTTAWRMFPASIGKSW